MSDEIKKVTDDELVNVAGGTGSDGSGINPMYSGMPKGELFEKWENETKSDELKYYIINERNSVH